MFTSSHLWFIPVVQRRRTPKVTINQGVSIKGAERTKGFFFRKTQEQTQWGGTNNLDKSPRLHCDVTGMMVSKG